MEKYDVVILGSGLGGLVCGNILSKEGYHVCVVEKNRQIGGSLQTFVRDKCIIDTGVHYVGGLGEGENLWQFFQYMGIMDQLKVKQLDEDCFDKITFGNDPQEYKLAQGYERFVETLSNYFPDERNNLVRYCKIIKEICDEHPLYNVRVGDLMEVDPQYFETSVKDFIDGITPNEKLRNVLVGNSLLYAGVPDRTPVFLHALITNSYINSSWKLVDGSSQLSKLLAKGIRENGGNIIRNQAVTKLSAENGQLKYVHLKNGERIEGKNIISNINPQQTMELLEPGLVRPAYRSRIKSLENTIASFSLYLTFKENSFPYLNHNHYHFTGEDVWNSINYDKANWPDHFMFSTPASSRSTDYAESGVAMTYMRYDEVKKWEATFNTDSEPGDRGTDYDTFKEEKCQQVIAALEKVYPDIGEHAKAHYASTPLSYRDYIGSKDGNMYGILRDVKNPMKAFISSKTKIPNLFLTGQNIHLAHGVLGVTVGALLTCADLLGMEYLVKKIRG